MCYLNVNVTGLNGRVHPALTGVTDTQGVPKIRAHLKMLCNDLYTYKRKSDYQGGSPHCRLCQESIEDLDHIIAQCSAYSDVRDRILDEIEIICSESNSLINFEEIKKTQKHLTQFILDCSSLNLPSRFNIYDENIYKMFRISRDFCYYVKKTRSERLKSISAV